jgi:hypothetical protein
MKTFNRMCLCEQINKLQGGKNKQQSNRCHAEDGVMKNWVVGNLK